MSKKYKIEIEFTEDEAIKMAYATYGVNGKLTQDEMRYSFVYDECCKPTEAKSECWYKDLVSAKIFKEIQLQQNFKATIAWDHIDGYWIVLTTNSFHNRGK